MWPCRPCTGWLLVAVAAVGAVAHLAEPMFGPGRALARRRPRVNDSVLVVLAYGTRTGTPGSPSAPTVRTIQLIAAFDSRMQP